LLDAMQWLALIAMTVDHASKAFGYFENPLFLFLGRMALPLFALMLAAHVVHSQRFSLLLLRLLALTIASQPGFYLFWGSAEHAMFGLGQQWNVIATLTLGAIAVKLFMTKHYVMVLVPVSMSLFLDVDYGVFGVLLMTLYGFTQSELVSVERREFVALPLSTIIVIAPFVMTYHRYELSVILSGTLGITIACALFWWSWFNANDSIRESNHHNHVRIPALLWRGFYPVHFWLIFSVAYFVQ